MALRLSSHRKPVGIHAASHPGRCGGVLGIKMVTREKVVYLDKFAVVLPDGNGLSWKMRDFLDHMLVPPCSHLGGTAFAGVFLLLCQALFFLVKRFGFQDHFFQFKGWVTVQSAFLEGRERWP